MTIVGTTYQTILNRLMLQSCQLCDVARDFRYDPRINALHKGDNDDDDDDDNNNNNNNNA